MAKICEFADKVDIVLHVDFSFVFLMKQIKKYQQNSKKGDNHFWYLN